MSKTNLCLITSPDNWDAFPAPHHYLSLCAWLEREGISCEIIDEKQEWYMYPLYLSQQLREGFIIKKIIKKVLKHKPRYIGLSAFTTDYENVMKLARAIKKVHNVPIIVGNAHATLRPEDFIYPDSPIDYVVIGEGEKTLTELINVLNENKNRMLDNVKGLAFLKDRSLFLTEKREMIQDLKELPMPAYHKINMRYYLRPNIYLIRFLYLSGIGIFTGRGCPFNCAFCAANVIWKKNSNVKVVRYRPVSHIIEELLYLKKNYKIDAFAIADDTFTLNKQRVIKFCQKMIDHKLDLVWVCQTRANLIDTEMVEMMKKAGCIQLEFGVESGSQRLLNKINKNVSIEHVRSAFELCKKHNLRSFANMLFNLPTETEEDIKQSEQLLDKIKPTIISYCATIPYPGTQMFNEYIQNVDKSEYGLFADRKSLPPKLRMADHNLDMDALLKRWDTKYGKKSQKYFIKNKQYWHAILKSKRKASYVKEYISHRLLRTINIIHQSLRKRYLKFRKEEE